MSIINEALKKTGQYLQENEAKNNPPAKIIPFPKPILIYILILLAGILLSKFIFGLISRPQGHVLASSSQILKTETPKPIAVTPTLTTASVTPLEEHKTPEPNFILNGIFFSDSGSYALVNNQIVRENDLVQGAKVTRITANTVELDSGGKLISLSTLR